MLLASNLADPPGNQELDQLEEFLDQFCLPRNGMHISQLDGFLTAIVSGPSFVPPSEWLPFVWGEQREDDGEEMIFESPEQAKQIHSLILRRMNEISNDLSYGKLNPIFIASSLSQDDAAKTQPLIADLWCLGYMQGMQLRMDEWAPLINSKNIEENAFLLPIMVLALPLMEIPSSAQKEYEDSLRMTREFSQALGNDNLNDLILEGAYEIYCYWRKNRHAAPTKASHYPGRNEPCTCSSGKKYKKCCGKA